MWFESTSTGYGTDTKLQKWQKWVKKAGKTINS